MADLRINSISPHVAQNLKRSGGSAIDGRTALYQGYAQSINARKRIEQVFGWIKQSPGLRQLKARGCSKVGAVFRLHVVAYNLIRITNLLQETGGDGMKTAIREPKASLSRLRITFSDPQGCLVSTTKSLAYLIIAVHSRQRVRPLQAVNLIAAESKR